jgi:hypothetical protein
VTVKLLAAEFMAQEGHDPPRGAHFILLAGIVIAAFLVFGVRWWRRRRGVGSADESVSSERQQRSSKESGRDASPDA